MPLIKESISYIFKQKNWKSLIFPPLILIYLVNVSYFFFSDAIGSENSHDYSDGFNILVAISIVLIVLLAVPTIIYTYWYYYESLQANLFKREIRNLVDNRFNDTIRKVLKYIALSLVYGAFLIPFILGLFFCLILFISFFGTALGSDYRVDSLSYSSDGVLFLATIFFGIILVLITAYVSFIVLTPAILRLVYTNTFTEGINFKANWYITNKYIGKLSRFFLINLGFNLVWFIPSFLVGLVYPKILNESEILAVIFIIIVMVPITTLSGFYNLYTFPYLLSIMYREIISKEGWDTISQEDQTEVRNVY
jgi:hypothetical protein